ncbi:tetratricopeptide repeat-containing protein [Allosphingosinicella sp.]|jgi:class 3 adenylate cyclase|uniref:tetratricopeptide repeat-containing protein n=1 Tax=Allosphingosinicella sp. TaxID=2823234 RepID=UPI002EFBA025
MSTPAERARSAIARGDFIAAYDIAVGAIAEGDASEDIRHQQVLALARMGDTDRAMEVFRSHGLEGSADPHKRAAGARLLKDRALSLAPGEVRRAALETASEAYHSVFLESGDSFPGINAATLALLAGRREAAHSLAETLLADPLVAAGGDYFAGVTKAEALLVLGRIDAAADALQARSVGASADHGGRASSRRQLAMIADHFGLSRDRREALLGPLSPPGVVYYAGHMFASDPAVEAEVQARIEALLAVEKAGFGYGALACGADILFAEALLERGAELNVVLPFAEEDFIAQSVDPGGKGWLPRYRACLEAAASVTFASAIPYFGDPAQYGYGSRMAMGLARLRAGHLDCSAVQLVVWDGVESTGPAGTGADVAAWRSSGGRSVAVAPGAVDRRLTRPEAAHESRYERVLAAILFTDFVGFSKLPEHVLPVFWDGIMRCIAEILDSHEGEVECRNSWGDALYAVTSSAPAAAEIALELQARLAGFDYSTLGLDGSGGMRVGGHYGPAYRTIDHITGRTTFYGTEVSRAARIEPVTPPGAVFVTEPLAAILALEARERFACRYVGRISLAKNYGEYPMYRLQRAG